jgi:pimeloyl-ACP methyl ester carboxylesterase
MDRPRLYSDAELTRLTMPIVLVFGGRDLLLRSREAADRLTWVVPHSRVLFDEGAGHTLIDFGGQVAELGERSELIYPFVT